MCMSISTHAISSKATSAFRQAHLSDSTPSAKCSSELPHHHSSTLRIILPLTPALTTPPTPNAGTILPILARLLPNQSLPTFFTLAVHGVPLPIGLLYRSKPQRCNGVLRSCIPAGARNCATLALLTCFSTSSEMGSIGAMSGGRLKEAKMVRESRKAKRA